MGHDEPDQGDPERDTEQQGQAAAKKKEDSPDVLVGVMVCVTFHINYFRRIFLPYFLFHRL
jgi:hypothetical protein